MFWAGYHYYKDQHLPEPISHLLLAFGLGIGSFWLGLLGYEALGLLNLRYDAYHLAETNLPGLITYAILGIGLIEELAKMIPFVLFIIHWKSFNEPIDGIIYASFIALGFAAVENFQYLQFATNAEAWARGIAGPVIHIVFASIWGYYIGRAFLCRRNLTPVILVSAAGTAILHGVYDILVIAWPMSALPQAAFLIAAIWIWRLKLI
ncbi:MAG: PrsW family intramembrane metalloprotease, partial [Gammaproteobacteria bacterium]|nr:PrsW family intramembrane metalloprotease [Gammaproteobacteria bacterium]